MGLSYNGAELRKALVEVARLYPLLPGLLYTSPYDFVAKHGVEYPVTGRYEGWRGVQLKCYGNAIAHGAMYGLKYVEGFAVAPGGGKPGSLPAGSVVLHAWNLDAAGNVYDSTWLNTGLCYVGVEFSVERADDATWNGDACVLNDDHRDYPIFQKPWTGEDYTLTWPPSDRLDALKAGSYELAVSVREWKAGRSEIPEH